jgi:hypothetical protein
LPKQQAEETLMLKRIAFVAVLVGLAAPALPQSNPRGQAEAEVAGKSVSIEYGRPSLKGRDMLALAEVGKPWRMGADAATTLTTEADLTFGAVTVPKGTYILTATKVDSNTWHLNVLSQADRDTVADIPLKLARTDDETEMFTIDLRGESDGGQFKMVWGKTTLTADFAAR